MENANNLNARNEMSRIFGTVTAAPELKTTESGSEMATCLLVSFEKDAEGRKRKTWHNVVAWGPAAVFMAKHLGSGRKVSLEGCNRVRNYADGKGKMRTISEFTLKKVLHLGDIRKTAIKAGSDC